MWKNYYLLCPNYFSLIGLWLGPLPGVWYKPFFLPSAAIQCRFSTRDGLSWVSLHCLKKICIKKLFLLFLSCSIKKYFFGSDKKISESEPVWLHIYCGSEVCSCQVTWSISKFLWTPIVQFKWPRR